MIYLGMDVSSKSFVVHAINERKKVVFKGGSTAIASRGRANNRRVEIIIERELYSSNQ